MRPAFAALALALLVGAAAAQPLPPFAAAAAKDLHDLGRFDRPDFSLAIGGDPTFAFYGAEINRFEQVKCEDSASFEFIAKANQAGGLRVGVCTRELKRVRAFAVAAEPALESLLAQLGQSGAQFDRATLAELGWLYANSAGPGGADEHYFPLLAVGHGVLVLPTVVLLPKTGQRAVVVQADLNHLCGENLGMKARTPLCSDTRGTLTAMARRVAARLR
jgi:hypothetical protein